MILAAMAVLILGFELTNDLSQLSTRAFSIHGGIAPHAPPHDRSITVHILPDLTFVGHGPDQSAQSGRP